MSNLERARAFCDAHGHSDYWSEEREAAEALAAEFDVVAAEAQAACHAVRALAWSSEPPAVPGWYWRRDPDDPDDPDGYVVQVFKSDYYKGLQVSGGWYVEDYNNHEWAGPIPEPTEPRKPEGAT
jgi:hypothetical protein